MTFFLVMFAAVTAVAQAPSVPDGPDPAQVQLETDEQQADEKAADAAPETFDPTEEVSQDYSIDFPVDI